MVTYVTVGQASNHACTPPSFCLGSESFHLFLCDRLMKGPGWDKAPDMLAVASVMCRLVMSLEMWAEGEASKQSPCARASPQSIVPRFFSALWHPRRTDIREKICKAFPFMSNVWAEMFPAGPFLVIFSLWFDTSPGMVCSLFPLGNFSAAYQFWLSKIYFAVHVRPSCAKCSSCCSCHPTLDSCFPSSLTLCLSVPISVRKFNRKSFLLPLLVFT